MILLYLSVVAGTLAIREPVVVDLVKNPPKAGEAVNRLLKVDYSFETETLVYDDIEHKVDTPSIVIGGNFSFETLHYDPVGDVLARFKMTACRSGSCDMNLPDVFISFVQGGNNINSVFIDTEGGAITANWNVLFSLVNLIYTPALNGEGDDQTVETVYGKCRVQFGRPENKKFRRIIDGCEIGRKEGNFTKLEYQDQFHYNQDVLYTQNTKVDADIIIIDAIELLSVRTPLDDRWGFQLESRTRVEITNRTQYYAEHLCEGLKADECATTALGLTKVGDKLYEQVVKSSGKRSELLPLLHKYREHLFDMGDTHTCKQHSSLYAQVFDAARKATPGEWGRAIQSPENEPILPVIANFLGAIGTTESLLVAREVLFVQGVEFLDDFLFGAAHSVTNDEKWHKQLMYWLVNTPQDSDDYWKIANAMATILRKRCDRSISTLNSCHKGKDRLVEKFIEELIKCKSESCSMRALEVFQNLPLPQVYELARDMICSQHPPAIQSAALRLLSSLPSLFYETNLVGRLVKLFRDTCAQKTSIVDAHHAVDILSNCVPELQHSATLVLRSETNSPDDHERWQYFYSKVKSTSDRDDLKEDFWKKMRAFKVFRPNYAQRSLVANSHSHWESLADIESFNVQHEASSHFDEGHFHGSDLKLRVKRGRKIHSLLEVDFWTNDGLPITETSTDHSSALRLALFDHSFPVNHLFSSKGAMAEMVANADGQTVKYFNGNIVLRTSDVTFPLFSGASVNFFSRGAATVSVISSVAVSMQYKEISADLSVNVSAALTAAADLRFDGKTQRLVESELSLITSYGAQADALAEAADEHVCQQIRLGDIQISLFTHQTGSPKLTKTKVLPRKTFKLHSKATEQCNSHLTRYLKSFERVPVDQL